VFWHSFEPGLASFGLGGVIAEIGLGVYGPDFARLDDAERAGLVEAFLADHRALLIWDNFESVRSLCDPSSATPPLADDGCQALSGFLRRRAAGGRSAVLVTSRSDEAWLDESRPDARQSDAPPPGEPRPGEPRPRPTSTDPGGGPGPARLRHGRLRHGRLRHGRASHGRVRRRHPARPPTRAAGRVWPACAVSGFPVCGPRRRPTTPGNCSRHTRRRRRAGPGGYSVS
jgi:hypothetical protein